MHIYVKHGINPWDSMVLERVLSLILIQIRKFLYTDILDLMRKYNFQTRGVLSLVVVIPGTLDIVLIYV